MGHAVDLNKDVIKHRDEEVNEQDVGNQEVDAHNKRRHPVADAAVLEPREPARRGHLLGEHFSVQHEVRLKEHLQGLVRTDGQLL